MESKYPILPWRAGYDIVVSWLVIVGAWYVVLAVSWWLYPIACIVIANRILALSLICHEGLHRSLHPNNWLNDFLGRYFCAFPTFISFSKYRRLHLLHHSSVGSDRWDPDRHLYDFYPRSKLEFLKSLCARVLTLRTAYDFVLYYTEYPEALRRKRLGDGSLFVTSPRSDFLPFVFFQVTTLGLVVGLGILPEYLLLYLLPLMLITQPYVMLMGGLQHGPLPTASSENVSRTVTGSKIYMWLLLPLDINYHAEHHLDPSVPHYWLKQKSADLRANGRTLWTESYRSSLRSLFRA
ncbi:MAG: fatty acid desaturase [Deltaproteobacteria bacterium]|jgi:fatty acid desaturase|nr:fatty acid desaturase [Deltaproteobacteria bacterium]